METLLVGAGVLIGALGMHQVHRYRKDDKADRRFEKHEEKLDRIRDDLHAHEMKVQSLEHAIQSLGERQADKVYGGGEQDASDL